MSSVVILGYHGINTQPSNVKGGQKFRRAASSLEMDIEHARRMGYQIISFYELSLMRMGLQEHKDSVILTFDDALISNHDYAVPVLLRNNAPATFFVPTDLIDRETHFTSAIVRDLAQRYPFFAIESHGAAHVNLKELSRDEAQADLFRSREKLKSLGVDSRVLALPYGDVNTPAMQAIASEVGFEFVRTAIAGAVQTSAINALDLPCYILHEFSDVKGLLNRREGWPYSMPRGFRP